MEIFSTHKIQPQMAELATKPVATQRPSFQMFKMVTDLPKLLFPFKHHMEPLKRLILTEIYRKDPLAGKTSCITLRISNTFDHNCEMSDEFLPDTVRCMA